MIKDSLKVQNRLMDPSTKNSDMLSGSTLQITFKKLPLTKFWCIVKEEYPQLSEKAIKILYLFPTTYLCNARMSSHYFNQNNIWQHIKCKRKCENLATIL